MCPLGSVDAPCGHNNVSQQRHGSGEGRSRPTLADFHWTGGFGELSEVMRTEKDIAEAFLSILAIRACSWGMESLRCAAVDASV